MSYYANGTQIPLTNGEMAIIKGDKPLGEGGQGAVYLVSVGGKDYALKWYTCKFSDPEKFYNNIKRNIEKGAPTSAFLWPLFLTVQMDDSFGYVMDLRPQNYRDFADFLLVRKMPNGRPTRFSSIAAVINACLNTSNGFRDLHRAGFSYQDLNDGNFFIDPETGDVLICDNDNVAPFGEALGIAGKARYMAPEIVRNQSKPDTMTDRFSMAVMLFRILFLDHPLEGQRVLVPCLTEELELKFYGKEPIFVYDRQNEENRPVRGVHSNVLKFWQKYPKLIQEAFHHSFSKEIMQMEGRSKRITDTDWQIKFTQLRDMLIECPCEAETFFDPNEEESLCIACNTKIPRPSILAVGTKYKVVLFPGKKLYLCHVDSGKSDRNAFSQVCGEVIRNPKNPALWGLKNLSNQTWNVTSSDDTTKQVANGEVLLIVKTKAIDFGGGGDKAVLTHG
jgi:serine/threonine protein kinase